MASAYAISAQQLSCPLVVFRPWRAQGWSLLERHLHLKLTHTAKQSIDELLLEKPRFDQLINLHRQLITAHLCCCAASTFLVQLGLQAECGDHPGIHDIYRITSV